MKRHLLFLLILIRSVGVSAQDESRVIEIKLYNNIYSQTSNFNSAGDKVESVERQSYITNILEINFFNSGRRTSWGLEGYFRASRQDERSASPFEVLRYESNGVDALTSFSHLGPHIVFQPSRRNENLHLKFSFFIPVGNTSTLINSNLPALDNSGFQFWSQINYNAKLTEGLYAYFELSAVSRSDRKNEPSNDFFLPVKTFVTLYPVKKFGIFGSLDFTPTLSSPTAHYLQFGGGIKIHPSDKWQVELSASKFILGNNSGAGYSFNLGIANRLDLKPS